MRRTILRGTSFITATLFGLSAPATATALPSICCVFTEPFIAISVFPGGLTVARPDQQDLSINPRLAGTAKEPTIHFDLGGHRGKLQVLTRPASDGMSDFQMPLTGLLSGLDSLQDQQGACLRFPDGTSPLRVRVATPDSRSNVRSAGSHRAPILGQIGPRGWFWAFPEQVRNGWVRGAFARYPEGQKGEVAVVEGWVHSRYLGPPPSIKGWISAR